MSHRKRVILTTGLLTAAARSSAACYDSPAESPDGEATAPVEFDENVFSVSRSSGDVDEDAKPHPHEAVYVRVISEDSVELLYERGDEVIVETYQIPDHPTAICCS